MTETLSRGLEMLGLPFEPSTVDRLGRYLDLLHRWNSAYNLSAIRDPAGMVVRHLLDSAAILPWVRPGRLLDLGTGAGLPGLPLALLAPGLSVTVLDSNGKKIRFLRQVVLELRLGNVEVVHARSERWPSEHGFDTVTSRAYTDLAGFWAHAGPHLGAGGEALAMKGRYPADELAALPAQSVSCELHRLTVPGLDAERHLAVLTPAGESDRLPRALRAWTD